MGCARWFVSAKIIYVRVRIVLQNLNRLVDCVMVAWDHNSMGLLNFKYSRKCEALQFKGIKQID